MDIYDGSPHNIRLLVVTRFWESGAVVNEFLARETVLFLLFEVAGFDDRKSTLRLVSARWTGHKDI